MSDDGGGTEVGEDRSADAPGPAIRRRSLLAGAGMVAAGALAGYVGGSRRTAAPDRLDALALPDTGGRWAADPDDLVGEPADTTVRSIDGTPVLFQYGHPVPSFRTHEGNDVRRGHRSLDGTWRFRFDPDDRGLAEGWHAPDHDDGDWRSVEVPLPWDLHDTPGFGTYDGTRYGRGTAFENGFGWYRRRVEVPSSWADRVVRANFLGVGYAAWVFVNGRFVGQHEGSHTPFALDASGALRAGEENVVAVRVFRRPWWRRDLPVSLPIVADTEVPGRPVDYWPYAGLTRSVYLEAVPPVTVSKLLVDAADGTCTATAIVENRGERPATRRLTVDPRAASGGSVKPTSIVLDPGEVAAPTLEFEVPDAPTWTPADPARHRLRATLEGGPGPPDALATHYGVRSIATTDGRLVIDGDPIFLKGVNWHEETAERGRSLRPADYDDLVERLADLGANALRNSHYPRHPRLYEAADEAGLLVIDEADNMWLNERQQWTQLHDHGLSRALVAATVWNQHNHPSVGLWSLHNECDHRSSIYRPWLADLRSVATRLDRQDRPVTWGARSPEDPAFDLADVVGFNEYFGYVRGEDDDLGRWLDALHRRHPDAPLLVTENGAWSAPELRNSPDGNDPTVPGTPAWQAATFRRHWDQVTAEDRLPFVAGYVYWNLRDYKQRNGYNQSEYNAISTMGLLPFGADLETAAYEAFRSAENPLAGGTNAGD